MQYRCSCCDQLKNENNKVYKQWDSNLEPEDSPDVGICRKCNALMKKEGWTGVKQMIEADSLKEISQIGK